MAYEFLLPKRKDNETETARTLNDLMDRGLIARQRFKTADLLEDAFIDKFLKRKENQYRSTEQKLGILERSRAVGLTPTQALNDDFLEEEGDNTSKNLFLSKRAADTLSKVPKAFRARSKASNTFSKLISAFKHR